MSEIRVRFAPSPTGPLHIGGVRTALYNYLFAKKHGGKFILRIEDTDQTRLVEGAEEYINNSLAWLGLIPDESVNEGGNYGPYKQSERKTIYKKYADFLIEKGWAYYAFDTPEDLEQLRKDTEAEKRTFAYDQLNRMKLKNSLMLSANEVKEKIAAGVSFVIRFKMPENHEIIINDLIRGEVKFNTNTLDDKVIFKSDGLPTYHLANVVDDHEMKISHVIRGEEWLPSLPLHVMLYEALGWKDEKPEFAHLPLILKPNGKGKLSKRDGDKEGFPVFPLEWIAQDGEVTSGYRESGYFPEAVINILALLGWNPGTEQELFSLEELIRSFSLQRVNKAGARFDPEKARWFNQQYLQKKTDKEIVKPFKLLLADKGISVDENIILKIVGLVKERAAFVGDIWKQSDFFFEEPREYDKKTAQKFWKENTPDIIQDCIQIIEKQNPFTSEALEANIKTYIESNELGFGKVMNPLRLALVGEGRGPHLFDIIEIIGKEETIKRLKKALEKL